MAFFNSTTKQTIDGLVPLGGAAAVSWLVYRKNADIKNAAIVGVVSLVVFWLITRAVTKSLLNIVEAPDHINVSPDVAGTIDQGFNPTSLTNELHEDIYSSWLTPRNDDVYRKLNQLSNANLLKVYNDWSDRYYSEDNETMVQAMQGESYGNNWLNSVAADAQNIIARLRGMGAQ